MRAVLAYIDPGVGATVMQLVLAGAVGIGALVKLRWHQLKGLFTRDVPEGAVVLDADRERSGDPSA